MSARRGAALVNATCVLLLCGCARNAVLELAIELPRAEGDVAYALVEVHPDDLGEDPFAVQWATPPLAPTPLGAVPVVLDASVVADGYRGDVLLRVRFCRAPDCLDLSAPRDPRAEVRARIERPLYTGARTSVRLRIPSVPSASATPPAGCVAEPAGHPTWSCRVPRCSVAGCIFGDPVANYCDGDDGPHFCE